MVLVVPILKHFSLSCNKVLPYGSLQTEVTALKCITVKYSSLLNEDINTCFKGF